MDDDTVARFLATGISFSSFKTLKREEVYLHHYRTFKEAQARLRTCHEDVSNAKRLHSFLDYLPPDEFGTYFLTC